MPLFTSKRDSGFVLGINRELMHSFSSVEIGLFKLDLSVTDTNIYEESVQKAYKPAVRLYVLMDFGDKSSLNEQGLISYEREINVGFLKEDLKTLDIVVEEGDIIDYDGGFYEIDQVGTSQYWSGRNPNTLLGITQDGWDIHGYDIAVNAQAHLTRTNALNIIDTRTGVNDSGTKNNSSIPKFL